MAGGITKDEQDILYYYIVKNISTTKLQSQYGFDMGYIESVFIKYNINYPDRNNNSTGRGFKKGFHLGKYKNGYTNNLNKKCVVDGGVINDYMACFLSGKCATLEEYLEKRFTEKPQPRPQSKPQPRPQNNPQTQYKPQQPQYTPSTSGDTYYNASNTSAGGSGNAIDGAVIFIVIVGAVLLILYKAVLAPVFAGIGAALNPPENNTYYVSPTAELSYVTMDVSFEGNSSQMFLKSSYLFHVDEANTKINIGKLNSLSGDFEKGEHKIWVQSGKKKSKVYTINITEDEAYMEFDCSVGVFGPKLKLTGIEGAEKK